MCISQVGRNKYCSLFCVWKMLDMEIPNGAWGTVERYSIDVHRHSIIHIPTSPWQLAFTYLYMQMGKLMFLLYLLLLQLKWWLVKSLSWEIILGKYIIKNSPLDQLTILKYSSYKFIFCIYFSMYHDRTW